MTPKEKAAELIEKFKTTSSKLSDYSRIYDPTAKIHALVAVDEIIESNPTFPFKTKTQSPMEYWEQVKEELDNL